MKTKTLNTKVDLTELDIQKAKMNFFSYYILEELSEDIVKINEDMEKEDLVEYIFNTYDFSSVLEGIKSSHNGDCTLSSHTCIRCFSEVFFNINSVNFTKYEGNKMLIKNRNSKNEDK